MAVATLYPSQDTWISDGDSTRIGGSDTYILPGTLPNQWGLVQFSLSSIPAGSVINSAVFALTNIESYTGNENSFYSSDALKISRVTSAWSESTASGNNKPSWSAVIYTFSAATYGTKTLGQQLNMDITQMVMDWFAGMYPNYGLSIAEASKSGWFSNNYTDNPSYRPMLTVNYTPPNVAPNAPVLGGTDGMIVSTKTPTVTWTYSDPDGNPQGSYLVEVISGDYMTSLFSTGWLSGAATSYTIPVGKITTDGQYYLRVRVMDSNGAINQANGNGPDTSFGNKRIVVDTTAPTIASVQGYSYSNAASGTRRVWAYGASDATSGIDKVYCNYTRPDGSVVNSVQCTASGSDYYVDIPVAAQGEYKADFYCQDKAGNWMVGSKSAYFFVDSQRANDPNGGSVYDQTTATINWRTFADPTPSSGYKQTILWLGEWDGTNWVGGAPNKYNGVVITTNINVLEQSVTGLTPGKRYRYAVAHYDNADNQSAFTWFEFVTKKKIGEFRSGNRVLPVYDPNSGVLGSKALRVGTANGVGCFELVSVSDANATPIRISTPQGIRSISK